MKKLNFIVLLTIGIYNLQAQSSRVGMFSNNTYGGSRSATNVSSNYISTDYNFNYKKANAILLNNDLADNIKYQYAYKYYNAAINSLPDFYNTTSSTNISTLSDAYYNRGFCAFKLGWYPKALQDFNTVIQFSPNNAEAYLNRGIVEQAMGAALVDINKARQLNSKLPSVNFYEACLSYIKGNYKNAILYCDTAIMYDTKFKMAYVKRANSKINLTDYDGALADLNKAINISWQDPTLYNYRGLLKMQMHDFTSAAKDFSKAIDLDDTNSVYKQNLQKVRLA
ncbi:MAG TPA: tetratricopeptide repeat protein, partial [Bacteroidia bacterium]|nr:tetratricopeptide repeat protein [Bacteroidia bacterium]